MRAAAFAVLFAANAASAREVGNLVIDGVPDLPPAVTARVSQYENTRAANFLAWAPDGKSILVRTRFGNAPQIHQVKEPGGDRRQLTFFSDPVAKEDGARFDPTRPGGFLFRMDSGGGEFYQNYWFDLKTGRETLLTDGKSRNEGLLLAHAGGRFAYTSTLRDGKDNDVYIGDATGPGKLVKQLDGAWMIMAWSPDDKQLLLLHYVSINEAYLHVLDVASGDLTEVNPAPGKKISYGLGAAAFAHDGKSIYYLSDEDSEFLRLSRYELASKKKELLTPNAKWDVYGVALSEDGETLAWAVNEGGTSAIYLAPSSHPSRAQRVDLPTGVLGPSPDAPPTLRFDAQGTRLACDLSTSRSSSDVYVVDVKTRKVTQWTFSELGGLDPASFTIPTLIEYPTFDGKKIPAWYYPARAQDRGKRAPVIVYIHGGPESQFQPGFSAQINYWITELGVAVIAPNVRGSSGYGKTYLTLDDGMKREDSVKDLGALLDWIAQQPQLDASRIGLYGGSYGGFMVMAGLFHYPDKIRCGIEVVGISNYVTFLEHTESYRRDLRRAEYGDERDPKMREFLLSISPTTNADKIHSPLFVAQGKNDPRVPAGEADQIAAIVRKNGGTVWYVLAKDEGHGFQKQSNREYLYGAASLFWQTYLTR